MTMDEDQRRVSDEPGEDLTSISEEEFGVLSKRLVDEEWAISYLRRVIQGRIDGSQAEPARHGGVLSGEGRGGEEF
ncbi:hypothetical protein BH24ACT19_BH24ACT19_07010 [soil metagenome]|jgi:hypothetical protein